MPFPNTLALHDSLPDANISAVERTARRLRDEIILLAEPGLFLGSEEELIERMQVSRATFRQAIRLLEHEGLLTIRRGNGGGFFSCQPSAESVARAAAVYLQFNRTSIPEVLQMSAVMRREAIRHIAGSADAPQRLQLKNFIDEHRNFFDLPDRREATRIVNGFHTLIASLSGNSALELFMNVVKVFGGRSRDLAFTKARLRKYAVVIEELADAVARGDIAQADQLVQQELQLTLRWLSSSHE